MDDIISLISQELVELKSEYDIKNNEYNTLNLALTKFIGTYCGVKTVDFRLFNEIKPTKSLVHALICYFCNLEYFDEIFDNFDFIDVIYKRVKVDDAIGIMACLNIMLDIISVNQLDYILKCDDLDLVLSETYNVNPSNFVITENLDIINEKINSTRFPIDDLIEFLYNTDDPKNALVSIIYGCIINKASKGDKQISIDERLNVGICNNYLLDNSHDILQSITRYLTKIRKNISAHEEMIEFLEKNKDKEEIIKLPIGYKKLNSDIQYLLVKTVYHHNMKYNRNIEKEYLNCSQDSIKKRKQLLKKYSIDDESLFFRYEFEELEDVLIKIKKIGLTNHQDIQNILETLDTNKLNEIVIQYELGFLNTDFINSNFQILSDDDIYTNVFNNLSKLKSFGVLKNTINNSCNILLTENEVLRNNLDIIETYLYKDSLKSTSKLDFITTNNLEKKLDIMIELGFEKNLEEDLSLLNYDFIRYKRLIVLNRINLLPCDSKDLLSVLQSNKFMISDDKLDDYILNISDYTSDDEFFINKDEFIKKLDNYQSSNRLYTINGVNLSKFRILRLINKLNKDNLSSFEQFEILAKNKFLNSNEYISISNYIDSKTNEFQKVKVNEKN